MVGVELECPPDNCERLVDVVCLMEDVGINAHAVDGDGVVLCQLTADADALIAAACFSNEKGEIGGANFWLLGINWNHSYRRVRLPVKDRFLRISNAS